jgi:hypothetical protein
VEYKRPLIVLLIFACLTFLATNFGGHIFSSENFVDPPYTCSTGTADKAACINVGGFWKEDGNRPAECDAACLCCVPNASFPLSVTYPAGTCPASNDTFTHSNVEKEMEQSFLLTNTGATILSADAIVQHLKALETAGRLKAPPKVGESSSAIYAYLQADEAALKAMQDEYCHYATRYRYCITKMIEGGSAGSASGAVTPANWVTSARLLNARLQNLVAIMKALTEARMKMGPDMGGDVAKLNADLSVRMNKLSEQSNDLTNGNADTILYKKMVQYTRQKAKANSNLVLLYTFMNLVALGMLFYVYRAT